MPEENTEKTKNAETIAETVLAVTGPKEKEERKDIAENAEAAETMPDPKEKKEDQSKNKEEEQNAKKTDKAKTKKKKPEGKPRAEPNAMKLVQAEGKNLQLQRRRQSRKKNRPGEIMDCAFL